MHDSFWEEVERSKMLTPEQRIEATLQIIDISRELMRAGIRHQFPDLNEEQVHEVFLERLRIARELENMSGDF